MLRVLIADDEPLARRALRRLLAPHADVDLVGEADSLAQAIVLIRQCRPDLVLLDIELNDGDGFDLLAALETPPLVVFVTAYAEHAVEAFAVAAVDYLLKPVAQERIDTALARVRRLSAPAAKGADARIELRLPGRVLRCAPADILAVRAEGDFSRVLLAERPALMILRGLGQFEASLPSPPFLRLGRSIIVNCERIVGVEARSRDEVEVALQGMAAPIRLGRAAAARLKSALSARRG
ncbi:response regulator transcription factor [Ancylobacter dichloromethanicus]|uniref:DNA-binding response regulator n=1 Tax=Ancylobacter dichloromethanicus TaxID=518825 RepID=A0A9W6J7W1_9HYPH|nr:LytTR family DNA-binding domain-containing protein [Ancylobacter dichloromethanicus]MBS7555908.1 response regulator transcription factor [Ancylobacter dichloromethanicus]GLK72451.1 DNA-binding response regulator [Ancylobacter dichloromethanicus]